MNLDSTILVCTLKNDTYNKYIILSDMKSAYVKENHDSYTIYNSRTRIWLKIGGNVV